jgi:triosephosphate isomerase
MRKLIAGNWKMNGLLAEMEDVASICEAVAAHPSVDTALCIPAR